MAPYSALPPSSGGDPGPGGRDYVNGWAAMTKLMHQGYSWSGHERKVCLLNGRDGAFATVSSISGLDFDDDGRSAAVCDWDEDGRLDLWLKNRSGPQLRFMRNDGRSNEHFLSLRLYGKTSNRDAIGATAELHVAGRRLIRTVTCGDGYLSQSSKWLHFGLGSDETIERLIVRWPGGSPETITGLQPNQRYVLEQGVGKAVALVGKPVRLATAPPALDAPPGGTSIVLRAPLPVPPLISALPGLDAAKPQDRKSAKLVAFWAQWCAPCIAELKTLARESANLEKQGLALVAVNLDAPENHEKARALFQGLSGDVEATAPFSSHFASAQLKAFLEELSKHLLDRSGEWTLPLSFLIDHENALQVIYLGPVSIEKLVLDLERFVRQPIPASVRSAFRGRWYFRIPRDWAELGRNLKSVGLLEESAFYARFAATQPEVNSNPNP